MGPVKGSANMRNTIKEENDRFRMEPHLKRGQDLTAIATLAGGIAHQFNNALFVITASLELLEMKLPRDAGGAAHIKPMRDSAFRMAQLTRQLLYYARGGSYQVEPISLSDLVREKLALLRRDLESFIQVKTDLQSDCWKVQADGIQIQAILSALLSNSVEAMDGEGRIKIACRNKMLTGKEAEGAPALTPGPYVCMTIDDSGKGMDEETRKRVFEPFFTTKFVGRGLGLAAVYGIVKNHNGWIAVQSQPGRGTTVDIYLPAVLDAQESVSRSATAARPAHVRVKKPRKVPAYAPASGFETHDASHKGHLHV